ncbi:MAG: hypothetical protein COA97_13200 [Flavobacteriales bacterium]|nr:MAG: hypothetical protein COA97_13200 [Flavobacteriales bacterium]
MGLTHFIIAIPSIILLMGIALVHVGYEKKEKSLKYTIIIIGLLLIILGVYLCSKFYFGG